MVSLVTLVFARDPQGFEHCGTQEYTRSEGDTDREAEEPEVPKERRGGRKKVRGFHFFLLKRDRTVR